MARMAQAKTVKNALRFRGSSGSGCLVNLELACANASTYANTKNNGNKRNLYLAYLM
jgi:hypothetical protein